MNPPRIVLDTNVLLSCLLFKRGSVTRIRNAWQSGSVIPLASGETARELLDVLAYPKFKLNADEQTDILGEYLPWCQTVNVPDSTATPDCRDLDDRPFLQLAVAGNADALVTGDLDILALSDIFRIPILTPAAFQRNLP